MDLEFKDGDIEFKETNNSLNLLIRRAIITPKYYLSRYSIDEEGIILYDFEYGNKIYYELNEAFTHTWLERSNKHIREALSFVPKEIKGVKIKAVANEFGVIDSIEIIINSDKEYIERLYL